MNGEYHKRLPIALASEYIYKTVQCQRLITYVLAALQDNHKIVQIQIGKVFPGSGVTSMLCFVSNYLTSKESAEVWWIENDDDATVREINHILTSSNTQNLMPLVLILDDNIKSVDRLQGCIEFASSKKSCCDLGVYYRKPM